MKKLYIMILLVLTGTMALAQTSVWHGERAIWTRGTGTQNDPFLIESADNLAYLAYVVNKGFDTQDMYFRLTTNIDLNGSEDQQWVPIGIDMWFSEDECYRGRVSGFYGFIPLGFRGHFDGGEHEISNIYIDNSEKIYGNYGGLFGKVQGVRDGQDTYPAVVENVFVTNGFIKGSCCGGIVANGNSTTLVSRCWNGATIVGTGSGMYREGSGCIVGTDAYQVVNCYNKGDISGYCVGGIVGTGSANLIEECYNEGDVTGTYAGGIFGAAQQNRMVINNCYNMGSISADGSVMSNVPVGPAAAGIAAYIWRISSNNSITNCYNVGAISSTKDAGCIVAFDPSGMTFENNFYISTCDAGGEGDPLDEDFMQSQAFVDFLNSLGTGQVWVLDENNTNGGFPVLAGIDLAVGEMPDTPFSVYPNPTQGQFTVEGTGTVRIINMMGQVVGTREIDGRQTFTLPKGMYFVTLNGQTAKVVVE